MQALKEGGVIKSKSSYSLSNDQREYSLVLRKRAKATRNGGTAKKGNQGGIVDGLTLHREGARRRGGDKGGKEKTLLVDGLPLGPSIKREKGPEKVKQSKRGATAGEKTSLLQGEREFQRERGSEKRVLGLRGDIKKGHSHC